MAEFYTQFSCLLDVGSAENVARALKIYHAFNEEAELETSAVGFDVLPLEEQGQILLQADEIGDPEQVILFVKTCACAFGLTGLWGFQYANTCSRLRPDAFGGGAHVLDLATGETVDWTDSDGWLAVTLDGGPDHA